MEETTLESNKFISCVVPTVPVIVSTLFVETGDKVVPLADNP